MLLFTAGEEAEHVLVVWDTTNRDDVGVAVLFRQLFNAASLGTHLTLLYKLTKAAREKPFLG